MERTFMQLEVCTRCGKKLEDNVQFCGHCGTKIQEQTSTYLNGGPTVVFPEMQQKKSSTQNNIPSSNALPITPTGEIAPLVSDLDDSFTPTQNTHYWIGKIITGTIFVLFLVGIVWIMIIGFNDTITQTAYQTSA